MWYNLTEIIMPETNTSNISENPFFHQLIEMNKSLDKLTIQLAKAQEENERLNETIRTLTEQLAQANAANADLAAQLKLMAAQKYGKSSEKRKADRKDDKDDHDEPSSPSGSSQEAPVLKPSARKRPARSRTRKPKMSLEDMIKKMNLPVTDEYHELTEGERLCSVCGTELKPIGNKFMRYEVKYIPGRLEIIRHHSVSYSCPECKRRSRDLRYPPEQCNTQPVTAPVTKALLQGKWVSASLVSFVIVLKALYQMPINRIRTILRDLGFFAPSVSALTDWANESAQLYLKPVFERFKTILVLRPELCADETTLQVINESHTRSKTKSYLWQYRTVDMDEYPIVLFEYRQGRSGSYAASFLKGFSGTLLVDGYSGYSKVECGRLANCWVHARRYLIEAAVVSGNRQADEIIEKALSYIDRIFDIEYEINEGKSNLDQRLEYRHSKTTPVVNDLFDWVKTLEIKNLPGEKTRKAFNYLLNHETGLRVFLNDPMLPAHNNGAEQDFVSVARGRNNWLFAYSEEGAESLALMFSVVKTAKRNGLNVVKYLEHIFTTLINWRDTTIPNSVIDGLLPWTDEIQNQFSLEGQAV